MPNNALVPYIEQEIQQSPYDRRITQVNRMQQLLDNELNDSKFNPTSSLNVMARLSQAAVSGGVRENLRNANPGRAVTITEGIDLVVQFAYAFHTLEHLSAIVESSPKDAVYLNSTECNEEDKVGEI